MSHPGSHRAPAGPSSGPGAGETNGAFTSRAQRRQAQAVAGLGSARTGDLARPTVRYANRSVARHGRLSVMSPTRTIGKGLGMIAAVLAATMVVLGLVVFVKFNVALGDRPDIGDPSVPPLAQIEGGANILLIGSDDRTGQGEEFGEGLDEASGVLNDVNILIHVSEDQQHITAVSIPRDTIVDTPACTNDQGEQIYEQYEVPFNSILGEGGMSCVVAAAEQLSGLDVQYAAMVQFKGVIEMSNALGGVEVCVAQEISDDYVGLYLTEGKHTLQGASALAFLRSRHGVGDGSDLSRISNQQVFLSAMIREVQSAGTLTSATKIYGLATAVVNNMTLSSSFDTDTIVGLANVLASVPAENIVFAQLPVGDSWQAGKVEPLEPDAQQMWDLLAADQPLVVVSDNTVDDEAAVDDETGAVDDTAVDDGTGDVEGFDDGTDQDLPGVTATPTPTISGQNAAQETCSNV